jgi:hypothetical protein
MPGDGGLDGYIGQSVGGIQLSRSGRTNQMAGVRACYQQGREMIMKGKYVRVWSIFTFLWCGCLLSQRELKRDFDDQFRMSPSLFVLSRSSSISITCMMSLSI